MPDDAQWEAMRQTDIEAVDINELVDATTVQIDPDAPTEERARAFLAQIKNPYAFRVGNIPVKVEFAEDGIPLADALLAYLKALRQGG